VRLRWKVAPHEYVERYERDADGSLTCTKEREPPRRIDRAEVAQLYLEQGLSTPQISAITGFDAAAIFRALRASGVPMRTSADRFPVDVEAILHLYVDERLGYVEVSRRLGYASSVVRRVLRDEGVTRRVGRPAGRVRQSYEAGARRLRPALLERAGGACEVRASEKCRGRGTHSHHRKLRSQGGANELVNLLAVCIVCHMVIHQHPTAAYANGWLVHSYDDPAATPVLYRGELRLLAA
jgi:hypothetical protein